MTPRLDSFDVKRASPVLLGLIIALLGWIAAQATVVLSGTKTGIALAIAAVFGPVSLYYALTAPLIFPFCVYVLLVPFDYLLDISQFGTLTKLLGMLSAAAIVIYLIRARRAVAPSRSILLWVGYLVWIVVTSFWAIDPGELFKLLPTAAELFILYAIVAVYPVTRRELRWVLGAVVAGGMVASLYGTYVFESGRQLRGDRLYLGAQNVGPHMTYIDPNHFGAGLLLPFSIALVAAVSAKAWRSKVFFGLAAFVLAAGIAVSSSRGATLAVGVMLVYLFVRGRWRVQLLSVAGLASLATLAVRSPIWQRFGQALSSGGSGRTDIWQVGLAALKTQWLLGAGYNNFPQAYNRAFVVARDPKLVFWGSGPHDIVIGTAVELGVIGLALLLAAWWAQFAMLRSIEPTSDAYPLRLALEAATLGVFVAAIFLDVMVTKYLWLTFMVIALARNAELRSTQCETPSFRTLFPTSVSARLQPSSNRYDAAG